MTTPTCCGTLMTKVDTFTHGIMHTGLTCGRVIGVMSAFTPPNEPKFVWAATPTEPSLWLKAPPEPVIPLHWRPATPN